MLKTKKRNMMRKPRIPNTMRKMEVEMKTKIMTKRMKRQMNHRLIH